jgi:hypothetical protein
VDVPQLPSVPTLPPPLATVDEQLLPWLPWARMLFVTVPYLAEIVAPLPALLPLNVLFVTTVPTAVVQIAPPSAPAELPLNVLFAIPWPHPVSIAPPFTTALLPANVLFVTVTLPEA